MFICLKVKLKFALLENLLIILLGKDTVPAQKCSSTTYIYFGTNYESSATYKTFNSSSLVLCQTECNNDLECSGFGFNSLTQSCELSKSTLPRTSLCSYCSFSARVCSSKYMFRYIKVMLGKK